MLMLLVQKQLGIVAVVLRLLSLRVKQILFRALVPVENLTFAAEAFLRHQITLPYALGNVGWALAATWCVTEIYRWPGCLCSKRRVTWLQLGFTSVLNQNPQCR